MQPLCHKQSLFRQWDMACNRFVACKICAAMQTHFSFLKGLHVIMFFITQNIGICFLTPIIIFHLLFYIKTSSGKEAFWICWNTFEFKYSLRRKNLTWGIRWDRQTDRWTKTHKQKSFTTQVRLSHINKSRKCMDKGHSLFMH